MRLRRDAGDPRLAGLVPRVEPHSTASTSAPCARGCHGERRRWHDDDRRPRSRLALAL